MSTYNFSTVRLLIHQPRLNHVSEWSVSVEELLAFGERVRAASAKVDEATAAKDQIEAPEWEAAHLQPSEKGCRWCRVKATCPALAAEVSLAIGEDLVDGDFEDLDEKPKAMSPATLADKLRAVPLIEDWCKAVRAEAERQMLAGVEVPGFKLVQGRMGPRKWSDASQAEELLKGMKLSITEMYDLSLISPTVAEKRSKPWIDAEGKERPAAIGPRQWKKVSELITRSEGSLSVAPESDKRPAVEVQISTDEFTNLDSVDDLL